MNGHIFAVKNERWEKRTSIDRIKHEELKTEIIKDGVILPLVKDEVAVYENHFVHEYKGGVCDSRFNFIAGSMVNQMSFSCKSSYEPENPEKIKTRDESVVFGGFIYIHFGVMLTLSFTRLWWLAENADENTKIVFLSEPDEKTDFEKLFQKMFGLMGTKARFEIIRKPTRFKEILIPQEAFTFKNDTIHEKLLLPFERIRNNVLKEYGVSPYKKLYLSRTKFDKTAANQCINEQLYENFYKKRGYHIVHPQELPIEEQIKLMASADEIVSTYGTLTHLGSLFAKPGIKQVMLLRSEYVDAWFPIETALLQIQNIDWYIVEATKNPYPTIHDGGSFLFYPTAYFKEYLDCLKIPYEDSELDYKITDEQFKDYIVRWLEVYSLPYNFKRLRKPDVFPVLQALYYNVTRKMLDPKDFL